MTCRGFSVMPSRKRANAALDAVAGTLCSAERVSPDGALVVVERAALRIVLDFAAIALAPTETGTAETGNAGSIAPATKAGIAPKDSVDDQ